MFAWLPTRLTDAGVDETSAGVVLAVFTAMGVPASLAVPRLVARTTHHGALAAQFAACFAVGEIGFLFGPTQLTLLWAVVGGWGSGAFPLALTLIGLRSRTHATAGALSGFVQSLGYLFAGLGPVVTGVLREITGGWTASFAVLVAVLGLMVLGGRLAGGPGTVDDDLARLGR
jgi:CP family cyanate transporter-like MFS transporter